MLVKIASFTSEMFTDKITRTSADVSVQLAVFKLSVRALPPHVGAPFERPQFGQIRAVER